MAKAAKQAKKAKSNGAGTSASGAQLAKVITMAQGLESAIAALGLPALTAEERFHSDGRLRQGEPAAITAIFDTVDAFPSLFASLAGKDGGADPDVVETAPARASLAEWTGLAPLGALLASMGSTVSDALLSTASAAKAVSVPAYAIGKANAAASVPLRKALTPAIDFYGTQGRRRVLAGTRATNKAAKAAKAPKPAATA